MTATNAQSQLRLALDAATVGLPDSAWIELADRIALIDPVLGAFERLHAEHADHNSPPVREWPRYVMVDYRMLAREQVSTVAEAIALWNLLYAARADAVAAVEESWDAARVDAFAVAYGR